MIALAAPRPAPVFHRSSGVTMTTPHPPVEEIAIGALLPCPFCGGEPAVEADPWLGECVRVACANDACRVAPKTEYLLVRFADELREAWNGRDEEAGEAAS
jgi:hypothetical protein